MISGTLTNDHVCFTRMSLVVLRLFPEEMNTNLHVQTI